MKMIALTAATLFAISGSAFAMGSDHFGTQDVNQLPVTTSIDGTYTASINAPATSDAKSITGDYRLHGGNT